MKFVFAVILLAGAAIAADDTTFINNLIKRGEDLLTRVNNNITTFRTKNNYFVVAIEGELRILSTVLTDLKEERTKTTAVDQLFLMQAEQQVIRHENILTEMITLAERANNDPEYHVLLELIDALLGRAYSDIGHLVTHGQASEATAIEAEIKKIEGLEQHLKSLNYKNSPEEAQKVVEIILMHERQIEMEMYRIEHLKPSTPVVVPITP